MFIAALFTIAKSGNNFYQNNKCPSINRRMDKQNMVYQYNGLLFSLKKEWNSDACYNIDEAQKHYAKWTKPDTKRHILYDSIYIR